MAGMSVLDRAYAESLLAGIQSGFDHAESKKNHDGTITMTMYFKNGTSVALNFDKPKANGFKGVEVRVVDGENHLICIMDDDSEIDAGIIPTPERNIFEQKFINPIDTWVIQHGLGKQYPGVTCVDDTGNTIIGEIDYYSKNRLVITFCNPVSGKAILQ